MKGYYTDLEEHTRKNENYREVLFTGPKSQLVLMSLKPGVEIGSEVHDDHDQFIRVEAGMGKAMIGDEEFDLQDGSAIVIPAGAQHNVWNVSETDPLKLYTMYTPPEHPDGTLQPEKPEEE